jgi:hypothetical protein
MNIKNVKKRQILQQGACVNGEIMFKMSILHNTRTKFRRNTRSTILKDNRKQDGPEQVLEWREFHDQVAEEELDEWQGFGGGETSFHECEH